VAGAGRGYGPGGHGGAQSAGDLIPSGGDDGLLRAGLTLVPRRSSGSTNHASTCWPALAGGLRNRRSAGLLRHRRRSRREPGFRGLSGWLCSVHKKRRIFAEALDAIGKVSFAFFVPIYFSIVGLKLDLVRGLSLA